MKQFQLSESCQRVVTREWTFYDSMDLNMLSLGSLLLAAQFCVLCNATSNLMKVVLLVL